ncbi:MAG: helix-turn-helix transcriptional regulator [Peptococcaceae bacterium]|nr:helix-turn-helix transcriptional regulator [Peptococcaceae bacterium]
MRDARNALGLSQSALAEGTCSRSYIAGLESGNIRPTAENLSCC